MTQAPFSEHDLAAIGARFDDMRSGESFRLTEPLAVLEARAEADVARVLDEVEELVLAGRYAAGFVSYEAAGALNPHLSTKAPIEGLPLCWFAIFATREAVDPPSRTVNQAHVVDLVSDTSREDHDKMITTLKEAIAAGDTYQTNLTLRFNGRLQGDVEDMYFALVKAQGASYNALITTGEYDVASASPELFFELQGEQITVRPMKGTARRGRFGREDLDVARELRASAKQRAENVMIVDLLRNDLGRLAAFGSTKVSALFNLERYEHIWQMTSTVTAELAERTRLSRIMTALFPCGSVTGAPKASTMSIIAALEHAPRGIYCGAIGYLEPADSGLHARFSVAIRTLVHDRKRQRVSYGSGGGITWYSNAAEEYDEVQAKAAILTSSQEEFALFETMAYNERRVIPDLARHLARLRASACYFGFSYDDAHVRSVLAKALLAQSPGRRLRLVLERDGDVRVECSVLPIADSAPVRLALDEVALDSRDPLRFHKTTMRDALDQARARHPQADDVILVNEKGEICESSIANVALLIDGSWHTPARSSGLLAGTRRDALIAAGLLSERLLHVEDLTRADSLAVINSLRGTRRAQLISP